MKIPFIPYDKSAEHDLVVLQWWAAMKVAGDIERTFEESVRTPAQILKLVNTEGWQTYFAVDSQNAPWTVAWFAPTLRAVSLGFWVRRDRRHTRDAVRAATQAMEFGVNAYPAVIGVTSQKELLPVHEKLGYHVLGEIPGTAEHGGPVYAMMLTKESFEQAREARAIKRQPVYAP